MVLDKTLDSPLDSKDPLGFPMETLNLLSSIETHLLSLLLVVCLFSVKNNILSTWFKPEIWLPFSHSHMESAPKP